MLLVSGLLLLEGMLLELANLLGADVAQAPLGELVWTSLLLCAAAAYPAVRRNSAISAMIAAIAAGAAILAAVELDLRRGFADRLPVAPARAGARLRARVARTARRPSRAMRS